jgi:hypothetical protein
MFTSNRCLAFPVIAGAEGQDPATGAMDRRRLPGEQRRRVVVLDVADAVAATEPPIAVVDEQTDLSSGMAVRASLVRTTRARP